MSNGNALGAALALAAAAVWGGGDFSGGLAARRADPFRVLPWAAAAGLVLLAVAMAAAREALPSAASAGWAGAAGALGALGLVALFRGLATGAIATVAPTAAVVSAALPVLYGVAVVGAPGPAQVAGFAVAIPGIGLISRSPDRGAGKRGGIRFALVAGTCFGGFFIALGHVEAGPVFGPLAIARVATLVAALVMLRWRGHRPLPRDARWIALGSGLLDAAGNVLYLLATRLTRIDVAAVVASMYPAVTVVLATAIWKEPVSRTQWTGVGLCVAAVALISS